MFINYFVGYKGISKSYYRHQKQNRNKNILTLVQLNVFCLEGFISLGIKTFLLLLKQQLQDFHKLLMADCQELDYR